MSNLEINPNQLYDDAKHFESLCWDNPNSKKAMEEFEEESDYRAVGFGSYRSVFYREDLSDDEEMVVKFPNRVYKPEKGNNHNIKEYEAWNSMDDEMRDDFAEVLSCEEYGNYLIQMQSEGKSFIGAFKLMLKYRYSDYPSEDLKPANIGVIEDNSVILDYPWGEI